jgi:DNA-binding NtrC family response regulator
MESIRNTEQEAYMASLILLIAPEESATAICGELRRSLDAVVEVTVSRKSGLAALRRAEYSLVLLEESMATVDEQTTNLLYQNAGSAPVLELNFAITGAQRTVRQVRAALTRRAYDQAQARVAITAELHGELNSSLAGLLLESQLALRDASPEQAPKLRHVVELAGDLRKRLQV